MTRPTPRPQPPSETEMGERALGKVSEIRPAVQRASGQAVQPSRKSGGRKRARLFQLAPKVREMIPGELRISRNLEFVAEKFGTSKIETLLAPILYLLDRDAELRARERRAA